MFFFIVALLPACAFYFYALVNFQRELSNAKSHKSSRVEVIGSRLEENRSVAHDSKGTVVPSESTVPRERVSGALMHNWRGARLASEMGDLQAVYQLESAYVGPLFLVSPSDRAEDELGSSCQLPDKAMARHAV
jgi:hypothetical protein